MMTNGQQMDPLTMALLARQQQGGLGGATGPVLVPQQSQQMGPMISPQSGAAQGGGAGQGMAAAGGQLMDAYRQRAAMDERAQQAGRNKLLIDALSGSIKPGVGPEGMGFMAFGGPR